MKRSEKTKEQIFRESFALFTNGRIPTLTFNAYMYDNDGEGTARLQEWIVNNLRGEIEDWCTGIGVIEAVEIMYSRALENGNLSETKDMQDKKPKVLIIGASCPCVDKVVRELAEKKIEAMVIATEQEPKGVFPETPPPFVIKNIRIAEPMFIAKTTKPKYPNQYSKRGK
jgi:hypothetical protein